MDKEAIAQKIAESETRISHVVMPNTTNHYGTLFGGHAMQLMDEVAFIAVTRFCRKKVVTVSTSQIDFKKSVPADHIIEVVAKVGRIGNTSIDVEVQVFKEAMYTGEKEPAIKGIFTFVAVDENRKPIPVLD